MTEQTRAAKWVRNKEGNTACGTLYSPVREMVVATHVSLSEAKLLYPEFVIYEQKPGYPR